jgi:predicted AAA+ superfamily ATPase
MLSREQISRVIDAQKQVFPSKDSGVSRESLPDVPVLNGFATIITGLRRCGKNTLLLQLMRKKFTDVLFLNFEDIRLASAECDFVVMKNEKPEQVLQVAYELTPENREREIRGLTEAMDFFKTGNGVIISFDQHDAFMHDGKRIEVLPAWEFLTVK